jgi:hypothetical protein
MPSILIPKLAALREDFLTYRDNVKKREDVRIATDMFQLPENNHISAILYNNCDWIMPCAESFILVHNPNAATPVQRGWLGVGQEFWMEDSYNNSSGLREWVVKSAEY